MIYEIELARVMDEKHWNGIGINVLYKIQLQLSIFLCNINSLRHLKP